MFNKKKGISISEFRFGQKVKPKSNHIIIKIFLSLGAVAFIAFISIVIQNIIQSTAVQDVQTWTSSLPSYWGGIVGGCISGTISFIGVFLTILYYRNSDAKKSRIEHMPFINIVLIKAQKVNTPDFIKAKIVEVPYRNYEIDKNSLMIIELELENIGNGFANTLVLHIGTNSGGETFNKLLKVNEKEQLTLKFYLDDAKYVDNIKFGLQYIDCMTNEYIQEYTINYRNKSIQIKNGYPEFLEQTHSIGDK